MTIQDVLSRHRSRIDSLDIELIIAHTIGRPREFVLSHHEYIFTEEQYEKIEMLLERREHHEPIAYLLGHREFFGLDFRVTKATLIPRPETELMVEEILQSAKKENGDERTCCIVDVGTGSGAIIVSVANELSKISSEKPEYVFFGTDISQDAIDTAKENAKRHHLSEKIYFESSDLLENISSKIIEMKIDTLIIAANLPYLSHAIYEASMLDVKNFEPKSALVSEEDGLRHYRKLLEAISEIREKKQSMRIELFFEISPEQKDAIEKIIRLSFPKSSIEILKDLSGRYRLATAIIE